MATASSSWVALFRGQRAIHTLLLLLGIGVHAITVHILYTVLPSVVVDIGGVEFYAWAMMFYTLASIIGAACGGTVKATWDIRRGYLGGGLTVLTGVTACALAPHMVVFIVGCTLQGAGCGLLISLAYGMVSELYPAALRPRVLAASSGMWGGAALLGPGLAGTFAGMGWWRGTFWVMALVVVLLSIAAWYTLPRILAPTKPGYFPRTRLFLLGGAVVCLGLSSRAEWPEYRLVLIIIALLLLARIVRLDRRASNRLFPSHPLALKTMVGTAVWMFLLLGISSSQVTVFLPLVMTVLYRLSPLRAGYFTALLSLAWTVMALASAHLRDRWVNVVIVAGPLLMTCGAAALAMLVNSGSLLYIGVCVASIGAGIGLCFAHLSNWTISAAATGEETTTAASIPTIQSLGIVFGVAWAGFVANAAGLAKGVPPATIAEVATWVYSMSFIAPLVLLVLAIRVVFLHRRQMVPVPDPSLAN